MNFQQAIEKVQEGYFVRSASNHCQLANFRKFSERTGRQDHCSEDLDLIADIAFPPRELRITKFVAEPAHESAEDWELVLMDSEFEDVTKDKE